MMVSDLADKHCTPCEGGVAPLDKEDIQRFLSSLELDWDVVRSRELRRTFTFSDFMEAMMFVNDVAAIAEEEGHHPDMHISYKKVVLELTTHAIHGLSDNDFILARKIEVACS